MLQTPYELLLSLKQTGSVEEYRAQFELYAGPLRAAEPEYLKGIFLNGLKDAVKAELKLHPVSTLPELMDFAQRIDEKNTLLNPSNSHAPKGGNFTRNFPSNRTVTVDANKSSSARPAITSAATSDANSTSQSTPFRGRVFKKLTDADYKTNLLRVYAIVVMQNFHRVIDVQTSNLMYSFWTRMRTRLKLLTRNRNLIVILILFNYLCLACQVLLPRKQSNYGGIC
jgi:hypothetical protein